MFNLAPSLDHSTRSTPVVVNTNYVSIPWEASLISLLLVIHPYLLSFFIFNIYISIVESSLGPKL